MPSKKDRVNIVLGERLSTATTRAASRRGLAEAAVVKLALVERLLADGDLTQADLDADLETDRAQRDAKRAGRR